MWLEFGKKLMFFNIINDIFEKLAKPQVFSSVFLCLAFSLNSGICQCYCLSAVVVS